MEADTAGAVAGRRLRRAFRRDGRGDVGVSAEDQENASDDAEKELRDEELEETGRDQQHPVLLLQTPGQTCKLLSGAGGGVGIEELAAKFDRLFLFLDEVHELLLAPSRRVRGGHGLGGVLHEVIAARDALHRFASSGCDTNTRSREGFGVGACCEANGPSVMTAPEAREAQRFLCVLGATATAEGFFRGDEGKGSFHTCDGSADEGMSDGGHRRRRSAQRRGRGCGRDGGGSRD
eukprot:6183395-Pleurochrysis_carterae.AAC.1